MANVKLVQIWAKVTPKLTLKHEHHQAHFQINLDLIKPCFQKKQVESKDAFNLKKRCGNLT